MKNLRTILTACIVGAALGACGDAGTPLTAPDRPNRNGSGFGSGHRVTSDSTSSTTAAPSATEATADSTTMRNGSGFGSGH